MRKKTGRLLAFGLVICLLACIGTAMAGGLHTEVRSDSMDMEVQVGYDGRITYGKSIPVRVTVRNRGGDLEGILGVNAYVDSLRYDRYETEISIPAGGERTVVLPVKIQTRQDVVTAEIVRDGNVLCAVNAAPESVINPSAIMIGVLSSRPRNLANLDINQENDTLARYEYWQTIALTPETLPDDPELLDAFGILVLDDTDPAQLTSRQQDALREWVRRGHVLLCGGGTAAPRNLAFLGDMTTLVPEDYTVSDGVIAALESYVGRRASGAAPETALARLTGMEPLVSDGNGNGLVWQISAGSGRIYALAWEAGDAALNAESFMHLFYQMLLVKADGALYNKLLYSANSYESGQTFPGDQSPIEIRSMLPAAAGIVGGAMLLGCVLWALLRKKGATKWMWVLMPALALAAAAGVTLLSASSALNRPVAAAAISMVQGTDGRVTRYTGISAAAPRTGLHSYSMNGEMLEPQIYEDLWMMDEEENASREPVTLRVVRTRGEQNRTSINAESPWELTQLYTSRTDNESGRIEAEIWMESDGFHGTITNGTGYRMKEGAVLCMYGFTRVPSLEPGASTDFVMISADMPDPANPVYEDGKVYLSTSSGMYYVSTQIWPNTQNGSYPSRENILSSMVINAADQLQQERSRKTGSYREETVFLYCAEPEGVLQESLTVDGEKTENMSEIMAWTGEIQYRSIGKTGIVFYAPGIIEGVRCALDEDNLPAGDMEESGIKGYYVSYFPLNEKPTFRYAPENLDDIEITNLTVSMENWYMAELQCFVLNAKQKKWVEVQFNQALKRPEQYLDPDGNLYLQLRPRSMESYLEAPVPTVTLEGKVKEHAAP